MALKICQECSKEISNDARTCPHCGKPQKKKTRWGLIITISLILFTLIMIIAIAMNKQDGSVSVGEKGFLLSGGKLVPLAIDEASFDAWISASAAKDDHGQKILLASSRIIGVQNRSPVLVIDQGTFKRRVRILDGEYKGKSGWVAMEYVKKQ